MSFSPVPIWKEAPFLRLIIPFIAGILLQWNYQFSGITASFGTIGSLLLLLLFSLKTITSQFKKYWVYGFLLNCLLFFAGLAITFLKDGLTSSIGLTRLYADSSIVIAKLEEPLSEKAKSFKSLGSVKRLQKKDSLYAVKGNIIIYFQKDGLLSSNATRKRRLEYGSLIIFRKPLQPIKNSGNPGCFDYRRYCAFQQIYYQVYLKQDEYKILPAEDPSIFKRLLFKCRKNIVTLLQNYIPGKKESGLAEALLIGYKDDLDKNLVRSYSNTGVVHIIAISGLHIGLIYWLLNWLLNPITKYKNLYWPKPVLIVAGLWIFSLVAGGSPSVLRSAVMFSFIVVGQNISRKISVYNSLAASAFLLLCFNPYWLWDVGFQLSYAAVLSIIIFMKPVYNCLFIQNKILDAVWKLNAVTLSAQILTLPICLYYFHQFPNFFLITNLIAVPLSSIILLGEILLCAGFMLPAIANKIGLLLHWMIWLMNTFIELIGGLPFSVLENIQISMPQLVLSYIAILFFSIWLLKGKQPAFIGVLLVLLLISIERTRMILTSQNQKKIIIHNIPMHQSIDFVEGSHYFFRGDSVLMKDDFIQSFHLKPSRIAYQVTKRDSLPGLYYNNFCFLFNSKTIIFIEKPLPEINQAGKLTIDLIVISKNPAVSIAAISNIFSCKQIIFDASNSPWKISKWKTECDALNISYYSVPDKGAFVMNMN